MRHVRLTASTAALLLSSTALFAQQGGSTTENVFLDIDGTPVQVPLALAAQACDLDEAGVQQASQSRIEQSGLDDSTVQQLFAANAAAGSMNATGDGGTAGTESAAAADTMATAETSTGSGAVNAGTDTTSTAEASNTPAPGGEPVSVEDMDSSTNMAASDNASSDMNGVLEDAETTAADTTAIPDGGTTEAQGLDSGAAGNDQLLALAVCQVELTRAGELGISGIGDTGAVSSGG
jgi:hypothetical protein